MQHIFTTVRASMKPLILQYNSAQCSKVCFRNNFYKPTAAYEVPLALDHVIHSCSGGSNYDCSLFLPAIARVWFVAGNAPPVSCTQHSHIM